MAVNYADGTMLTSLALYPVAAAMGAAQAGAGRFSQLFFIAAGIIVGFGVTYFGRKVIYSCMRFVFKRCSDIPVWLQYVVGTPLFILYLVMPPAIVCEEFLGLGPRAVG